MSESWFLILNILVGGVTVLIILLYVIFLTRKRFMEGFLHRASQNPEPNVLQKMMLKIFGKQNDNKQETE
jgi:hypothetical protein